MVRYKYHEPNRFREHTSEWGHTLIISIEQRVRIFILSKEEATAFPDDEMKRRAKKEISDTYLPRIIQRAKEIIAQHVASVGEQVESEEEKPLPLKVQKATLLLNHISELEKKSALMNPRPSISEKIEEDRANGSINRGTLNLE